MPLSPTILNNVNLNQHSKPIVSIILPTRNRCHLIRGAVESVLNQTFSDIEVIIVDDGSTDKTAQVVTNLNDRRIRYERLNESRGAPVARNIGISLAKGEYIAFQDSDDEWLPQKLEKQMQAFEVSKPEVGVIYTGFYRIMGNEKHLDSYNKCTAS